MWTERVLEVAEALTTAEEMQHEARQAARTANKMEYLTGANRWAVACMHALSAILLHALRASCTVFSGRGHLGH